MPVRSLEASVRGAAFAVDQFQFAELQQERQVVGVLGCTSCGDFFAFTLNGRQLQCFEMMLQQDGAFRFGLLHGLPSDHQGLVSSDVRLLNPNQLQMRSAIQTEHSDRFFLLVFNDQSQGVGIGRSDFQSVLHGLLQF